MPADITAPQKALRRLTYTERIASLVANKRAHTTEKLRIYESLNTDDHGSIVMPEKAVFTPKPNHPNGGCYGARCVGENFGAMLSILPAYVHPMGSLLGAWYIDRPAYRTGPHWPPARVGAADRAPV